MALMTEPAVDAQPEGVDVYAVTYDDEGNEVRLLPEDVPDDVVDWSRHLGIGKGRREIVRVKHGPLVANESDLRTANVGSLGRAIAWNANGTALIVDRGAPPIDEDVLDIDKRYHLDFRDGTLVAVITKRYPTQPPRTPQEFAASLSQVAAAYDCRIVDVSFALPGGTTPEEMLADWPADAEWAAAFRAMTTENLTKSAHDVIVHVTTNNTRTVATLVDGATAIADFLQATRGGVLNAVGVLNLLRGSHFGALIGATESEYLEVKTSMHPIWKGGPAGTRAKVELAQDVARFANGDVDAILVIGYRETSGESSQIGSLTPVGDHFLKIAQINEALDARIVPPIDGLTIEKFVASPNGSVLAIYIPKQPAEMQPYLVQGAIIEDKLEGAFFSIVRRRGEGSITTSAQQIHAYIVAGKRHLRET